MKNLLSLFTAMVALQMTMFADATTPQTGSPYFVDIPCNYSTDFTEGSNNSSGTCLHVVNATTIPQFHISHGTPRLVDGCTFDGYPDGGSGGHTLTNPVSDGNLSTVDSDPGIYMGVNTATCNEGIFFDFNFRAGKSYKITFTTSVALVPADASNYFLRMITANGLATNNVLTSCVAGQGDCAGAPPMTTSQSQIAFMAFPSLGTPTSCVTHVITFSPNANYSQLWIYPTNTRGNESAAVVLEDICIRSYNLLPIKGGDQLEALAFGNDELAFNTNIEQPSFSVYPNPSQGSFFAQINNLPESNDNHPIKLKLYSNTGQLLKEQFVQASTIQLELDEQPATGIYFLVMEQDGKILDTKKVIVQR